LRARSRGIARPNTSVANDQISVLRDGRRREREGDEYEMSCHAVMVRQPLGIGKGRVIIRAMSHHPIHDPNLPKPVGPYSPGMGFERLVFVSGQGATDPATGKLAGDDAAAQTAQCLENVRTILRAGSDLQYALRCGVFLLDMKDFEAMNAVYSRVFGDHRPARTTIQAAALPGVGLRVEIDCIAYVP
jgi:2-iminobutanoate/2-iminopropanoate deaminase